MRSRWGRNGVISGRGSGTISVFERVQERHDVTPYSCELRSKYAIQLQLKTRIRPSAQHGYGIMPMLNIASQDRVIGQLNCLQVIVSSGQKVVCAPSVLRVNTTSCRCACGTHVGSQHHVTCPTRIGSQLGGRRCRQICLQHGNLERVQDYRFNAGSSLICPLGHA
jgi:hypothetical protein